MSETAPETLTFYTQTLAEPYNPRLGTSAVRAEVIIALESSHIPLLERRVPTPGLLPIEKDWNFTVPLDEAERLADFFTRTMIKRTTTNYECHSLPPFVSGVTDEILLSRELPHQRATRHSVSSDTLEPTMSYALVNAEGQVPHSILGLGPAYPLHNLSVLGRGGPLAITNTAELQTAYAAPKVYSVYYVE